MPSFYLHELGKPFWRKLVQYWLMKTEPGEFGLEDLKQRPGQTEPWDGVRNYQARNMMRDQMQPGDRAFFYHSNTKVPGIVAVVEITSRGYPDETQFDPKDKHYDPKSKREDPRWYLVDVTLREELPRTVGLREIKEHAEQLEGLKLVQKGNRLSVMPIDKAHWDYLLKLA